MLLNMLNDLAEATKASDGKKKCSCGAVTINIMSGVCSGYQNIVQTLGKPPQKKTYRTDLLLAL